MRRKYLPVEFRVGRAGKELFGKRLGKNTRFATQLGKKSEKNLYHSGILKSRKAYMKPGKEERDAH
jgi:hypothetical protein